MRCKIVELDYYTVSANFSESKLFHLFFLIFVFRRVLNLHQQIDPVSFVCRHIDIKLAVVDEHRIHDFGSRFFLLFSVEFVPEMGRQLTYLILSHRLLVNLVLLDKLAELVTEDVVVPVGVLDEFLANFFLEV